MTLLFNRAVVGPKTHAFVLGVGRYPHAKNGNGARESLRGVPDLPSASDSAKLVCDWLLENQDKLAAPLATLEVLISDAEEPSYRYEWAGGAVDPASAAAVRDKGWGWFDRLSAEPDSVAFFYCCGHGASHLQQPIVFLEDLNDPRDVWAHINLSLLASTLRKSPNVSAAFLFSDACGEYLAEFELGNSQDCRFFPDPPLFGVSRNQVSLMCAAAEAHLAYEGVEAPGSELKFGRFTQTVLKGLQGASARWCRDRWGVHPRGLLDDLKSLRRVYFGHWGDSEPFEPYQAVTQTDPLPIVYPENFELPVVIMTDPADRMPDYALFISEKNDPSPPWVKHRTAGEASAWPATVSAGHEPLFAIAVNGVGHYGRAFLPKEPLFEQWVPVP